MKVTRMHGTARQMSSTKGDNFYWSTHILNNVVAQARAVRILVSVEGGEPRLGPLRFQSELWVGIVHIQMVYYNSAHH